MKSAVQFLTDLFQGKHIFNIYTLPDKESFWFDDPKLIRGVMKKKQNIYVGVGIVDRSYSYGRTSYKRVTGLPGLFVDVDYQSGEAHKKNNLPQTVEDAIDLVTEDFPEPTIIVHSGNGIHAWWLFTEPWLFKSTEEKKFAIEMSQRMNQTIRTRATEHGWVVDSTFDLARVLRIPGTVNLKDKKNPKPVTVLKQSNIRYQPCDLDTVLHPLEIIEVSSGSEFTDNNSSTGDVKALIDSLIFRAGANPPPDMLTDLADIQQERFKLVYDKDPQAAKNFTDDSASSYDYSLAIQAAEAGWSDQEILDLLISFRRKHHLDMKFQNKQYYARTLLNARIAVKRHAEKESISESILHGHEIVQQAIDHKTKCAAEFTLSDDAKETVRQMVSNELGINVLKFIKYQGEKPSWVLSTTLGDVLLENISDVVRLGRLREHIASVTRHVIKCNAKTWLDVVEGLLLIEEQLEVSSEATFSGRMSNHLSSYLANKQKLTKEESIETKEPFYEEFTWYIYTEPFYKYVIFTQGYSDTLNRLRFDLKRFGAESIKIYVTKDGNRTSRHAWKLPRTESWWAD